MFIRKTEIQDLPHLLEIYRKARSFMSHNGNAKQWGETWPPADLIRQNILDGTSYVCQENEDIVGTFFFRVGKNIEPCYNNIKDGQWFNDTSYGVIHRLASVENKRGIATFCLSWCYKQCGHLRADTHPDNIPMRNLLLKCGFKYCGTINVEHDDMPRLAFEK